MINKTLASKDLKVPSTIGGVFELHNLNLFYFDDYIYAGATPVFLAPAQLDFDLL